MEMDGAGNDCSKAEEVNSYNIGDAANEDRAGMQREQQGILVAFGSVNIGIWFLWVTVNLSLYRVIHIERPEGFCL